MGDSSFSDIVKAKYDEEKQKRIRPDGWSQYVIANQSDKFKDFAKDPWCEAEFTQTRAVEEDYSKVVILGAGFGGILSSVHLLEASFSPSDLVIIDRSKGFGGTWYWNRYPGIMCDVESLVYLPLLEETDYMPKLKYSYGPDILCHAQRIVKKYQLENRVRLNREVKEAIWDEASKEWVLTIVEDELGDKPRSCRLRCSFLVLNSGTLTNPKIPAIPGIEKFEGRIFHSSRWDYRYTGGSPTDWTLDKLGDKRVALIGTGSTGIQIVPQLAKWAKALYVIQRTPAGVDVRGQHEFDQAWAEEYSKVKGWQKDRIQNFLAAMSNQLENGTEDMVGDSWTGISTARVLTGSPDLSVITLENMQEFFTQVRDEDFLRTERIRQRVDQVIKDPEVAKKLKAWYYTWCKRPCFHDDYLPSFNQPNVHLIDTDGAGVNRITQRGIVAGGKDIDVDLIIFSTGFDYLASKSPSAQAEMRIVGRNGLNLDTKWEENLGTLHGIITRDFPNLSLSSSAQSFLSPNQMFALDVIGHHRAFIMAAAMKKAAEQGASKVTVEPTLEAESAWTQKIVSQSLPLAIAVGCTPSYYNMEGELLKTDLAAKEREKMARGGPWTLGPLSFLQELTDWENKDFLGDLDIKTY